MRDRPTLCVWDESKLMQNEDTSLLQFNINIQPRSIYNLVFGM